MEKISAEVIGKFESEGDANKLVYAPLKVPAKYRRTRVYMLEYEGKIDPAKDFVQRSLLMIMRTRCFSRASRPFRVFLFTLITG